MRFVLYPHLYPQSLWVEMRDHIGNGRVLLGLLSGVPGTLHGTPERSLRKTHRKRQGNVVQGALRLCKHASKRAMVFRCVRGARKENVWQ